MDIFQSIYHKLKFSFFCQISHVIVFVFVGQTVAAPSLQLLTSENGMSFLPPPSHCSPPSNHSTSSFKYTSYILLKCVHSQLSALTVYERDSDLSFYLTPLWIIVYIAIREMILKLNYDTVSSLFNTSQWLLIIVLEKK